MKFTYNGELFLLMNLAPLDMEDLEDVTLVVRVYSETHLATKRGIGEERKNRFLLPYV